jgi:benzylsuccinate CoA-transferase BbsF subunit
MMGQTGPHLGRRGDGFQLTGFSGLSHIAGWPDRPPAGLGIYTDFIGSPLAVVAVMAALDYRRRTGRGQYIDVSQYEAGVQFMSPILLDYVVNQRIATRMGNSSPYAAPYGAYRCRGDERWCAIAVYTDEEWQSFVRVIGSPSWAKDPRFSTLQARQENGEELDRLVGEWTVNHEAEEIMSLMQTAGVAAGVAQTVEDLVHDPQLNHRHYFWEQDHPVVERYTAPGQSFVLSKSPCEVRRIPLLGEHNEYALKELLGLSDEEIASLVVEGVVE